MSKLACIKVINPNWAMRYCENGCECHSKCTCFGGTKASLCPKKLKGKICWRTHKRVGHLKNMTRLYNERIPVICNGILYPLFCYFEQVKCRKKSHKKTILPLRLASCNTAGSGSNQTQATFRALIPSWSKPKNWRQRRQCPRRSRGGHYKLLALGQISRF